MIKRGLRTLLVQSMLLAMIFSPGHSRPWKPTDVQLADDYALIQDRKSNTDFVIIKWWAEPTAVRGTPLEAILEKYVIISVIHFHVNLPGGSFSFEDVEKLDALDSNGHPLTPIPEDALPPTVAGILAGVKASFRQSAGRMGEGMKFFTFDAETLRACEKGKLSVPLAGET